MRGKTYWIILIGLLAASMLDACAPPKARPTQAPTGPLPVTAPPLPFSDNPDPSLCGIPQPDGRQATVTGDHGGELVQPIVYLYDSHSRSNVVGQIFPGTRVDVALRQANPSLNYFFVRTIDVEPVQSGWIPEPFLLFADPA